MNRLLAGREDSLEVRDCQDNSAKAKGEGKSKVGGGWSLNFTRGGTVVFSSAPDHACARIINPQRGISPAPPRRALADSRGGKKQILWRAPYRTSLFLVTFLRFSFPTSGGERIHFSNHMTHRRSRVHTFLIRVVLNEPQRHY